MRITLFNQFLILSFCLVSLSSCFDRDESNGKVITNEKIVGKWVITSRFPPLETDCEINEFIVFYADSSLYRDQCPDQSSYGTWKIKNDTLIEVDFGVDLAALGLDLTYQAFMIDDTHVKVQCVENSLFWAKYSKKE